MAVFCPHIETAADTAISAYRLGAANARLAHFLLGFGDLHDRAITDLGFDAFDDINHAVDRWFRQSGHEAGVMQHRFFHQCIARTDCHAVAAGDATRLADRCAAVPKNSRVRILPADRQCFVDFEILASLDATAAQNALVGIVSVERIRVIDSVRFRLETQRLVFDCQHLRRVVNETVAIVIVADRAVQHVIAKNAIERFLSR